MSAFNSPTRVSDHLVRLVEFVFALVIATSLLEYKDLVLDPFAPRHSLALLALAVVYMTTIFSWIDYHRSMELNPYLMHLHALRRNQQLDLLRLITDLLIVVVYTYLLFSISPFRESPTADIRRHLIGYFLVFLLYLLSGIPRILTYGKVASRWKLLFLFCSLYFLQFLAYRLVVSDWGVSKTTNLSFVAITALLMLAYRIARRRKAKETAPPRVRIGLDVDGVLADQVSGVLPRVNMKFGTSLSYEDITEWALPIIGPRGTSDIKTEIESALEDENYVLGLKAYPGVSQASQELGRLGQVVVATARSPNSDAWTQAWLDSIGISYQEFVNAKSTIKNHVGLDVLIEDYGPAVERFVASGEDRLGILIRQPWNQEACRRLAAERLAGRAVVVADLTEAVAIVRAWRAAHN